MLIVMTEWKLRLSAEGSCGTRQMQFSAVGKGSRIQNMTSPVLVIITKWILGGIDGCSAGTLGTRPTPTEQA
jgi:hypothetical protein